MQRDARAEALRALRLIEALPRDIQLQIAQLIVLKSEVPKGPLWESVPVPASPAAQQSLRYAQEVFSSIVDDIAALEDGNFVDGSATRVGRLLKSLRGLERNQASPEEMDALMELAQVVQTYDDGEEAAAVFAEQCPVFAARTTSTDFQTAIDARRKSGLTGPKRKRPEWESLAVLARKAGLSRWWSGDGSNGTKMKKEHDRLLARARRRL